MVQFPKDAIKLTSSILQKVKSSFQVSNVKVLATVPKLELLPPPTEPEVSFIGRSNAGKSSLVGKILGSSKLTSKSKKPGHTRTLKIYNVKGVGNLVDMPGYGFKSKVEWGDLCLGYFSNRKNLCKVYVLLDCRRGVTPLDESLFYNLNQCQVPFQLILTKLDKLEVKNTQGTTMSLQAMYEQRLSEVYAYIQSAENMTFCHRVILGTQLNPLTKKSLHQLQKCQPYEGTLDKDKRIGYKTPHSGVSLLRADVYLTLSTKKQKENRS